jgi:SH3-like domain-containing protein
MMGFRKFAGWLCAAMVLATPLAAQDRALPYWASLRYDEVRMRVGPSEEYPIEWVYKRKGLPVKVVRVREGWRLVEDPEGAQGWIASSQLNPARGVMINGKGLVELRDGPSGAAALKWRAQPGVVAALLRCQAQWCEVDVAGRKGWVSRDRLWGAEDLPGDE